MNRIALVPLALLPLLAAQDAGEGAPPDLEWHDLGTANAFAKETGRPLLIVFR